MADKYYQAPKTTDVAVIVPLLFDFSAAAQTFKLVAPFRCIVRQLDLLVVEVVADAIKTLSVKNGSTTVLAAATTIASAAGSVISDTLADSEVSDDVVFEAGDTISVVSTQATGTGTGYGTLHLSRV